MSVTRAAFISLGVYDVVYIVKRVEFLYCLKPYPLSLSLSPRAAVRASITSYGFSATCHNVPPGRFNYFAQCI